MSARPAPLHPFVIQGDDGRWVLAETEAEAREFADDYWSLDEVSVTPDGWFHNVGWDRETYERKRDFVAETGLKNWWESCLPPADGKATKNRMPAWSVRFR
jgi:hypothetical protein